VLLDRGWIENHIPHKGGMCLLDEVLAWDPARIRCRSATHRAVDNPLRAHGRLGAACGIEYAAQAMAVHGALIAATASAPAATTDPASAALGAAPAANGGTTAGYLASIRNVALYVARLDDVETDLVAAAERIMGDDRAVLYEFSVSSAERVLVSGRATIVFDAAFGERASDSQTPA
jgi:predicted hotdog family 3-hydroxylacyl-ACP dehydratase